MNNQNKSTAIIADNTTKNQEAVSDVISGAIKKINEQAPSASGYNVPAVGIYNHLIEKCQESEDFAACVNKEEKSIAGCFEHVVQHFFEAGMLGGFTPVPGDKRAQCVGSDSTVIFAVVDAYFEKTNEDLEKEHKMNLAAIEEKREQARQLRVAENKRQEEERKAAAKKKEEEKKKREEEKKRREEAKKNGGTQMSLFGAQDGEDA